ncbi:helix-turn-helix domain-containing protein [Thermoanaerobacterium sp. DL9XJH110]|uniref:helix-turn-helix domain-containing protein n=1 Tax=Thermoanaerobacterium sp. DL9XJH110 TaxID=3386643 RepID=UPI003BB5C941
MDIGERIKQIRISKNMQSNELANKVGISNVYLSYIEHGVKTPTIDTLRKICDALGITLAEFFRDTDNTFPMEYQELVENAKTLSPKQLKILNEIIKLIKE